MGTATGDELSRTMRRKASRRSLAALFLSAVAEKADRQSAFGGTNGGTGSLQAFILLRIWRREWDSLAIRHRTLPDVGGR
jgi:hypothetical protein